MEIGIFGLGHVGSAVAELCLARGLSVRCVDTDPDKVAEINDGAFFDAETGDAATATTAGESIVGDCDVIVVAVPTPLDSSYSVNLDPLRDVCETIAAGIEDSRDPSDPLIAVESTVPPGTGSTVVRPIFGEADLAAGQDYYLVSVPERIDPGNDEWPLRRIPRVLGAVTPAGRERAVSFYDSLLDADVHSVETLEIAESSKVIENAFRDVNIAFVNEIAVSFSEMGIDAAAALDAASTKPFGFMRFSPGAGVGGDCIPVDPYLLIQQAQKSGFDHRFLKLARDINDSMPEYVVQRTIKALNDAGILPRGASVTLLGRAFKPGIGDDRNSPYHKIRAGLEEYGVTVETYDPYLGAHSTVETALSPSDGIVLVTDHREFHHLDWKRAAENGIQVVVDGRNIYDPGAVEEAGIEYVGIGRR